MSILIKGMEMPKHCIDCPFMVSRDNDDCILQSAEANESFENWEQMKAGCPLVPVPPHGDLIDKDATMNAILEERGEDTACWFAGIVNDMPAIVPSDKVEEGEFWGEEYAEAKGFDPVEGET